MVYFLDPNNLSSDYTNRSNYARRSWLSVSVIMVTHGVPVVRQARQQVRVVRVMAVSPVPGTHPRCSVLLSSESIALIGVEEVLVAIIM